MDTRDFSSSELTVSSIDSLNELREVLRECKLSTMIGGEEEGLSSFYYLRFNDLEGSVGLCSYGQGKFSGCRKFNGMVVIFNDQMLYLLNQDLAIQWKDRIDGIIYDVSILNDKIIVVHEIGAKCLSSEGKSIWSHPTEIVVNHSIDSETLTLTTDESSNNISLIDGRITTYRL